jgi:hypothetical protein
LIENGFEMRLRVWETQRHSVDQGHEDFAGLGSRIGLLAAYRHYHTLMTACDQEIEACLGEFDSQVDCRQHPLPPARGSHRKPRGNEMHFDLRGELYRILGVDLTQVPGLNALTVHTLLAEIGPDLSAFPSGAAFASWLRLCPDNRISRGQVLSVRTRPVKSRVSLALRQAAQSLHRSQSYLGVYYRRLRAKFGAPKAITATAHKLARIVFRLLTTRQEYDTTRAFSRNRKLLTGNEPKAGFANKRERWVSNCFP